MVEILVYYPIALMIYYIICQLPLLLALKLISLNLDEWVPPDESPVEHSYSSYIECNQVQALDEHVCVGDFEKNTFLDYRKEIIDYFVLFRKLTLVFV